jgi:type VI secretion system secreted protein Hcp
LHKGKKNMAVNIFGIFTPALKITIPTETISQAYQGRKEGVIEIGSISLGIENPTTIGSMSGGAGAGKATFKPLVIKHVVGSSSPNFFLVAATGAHFDLVTFEFVKAGPQAGKPYFSIGCKMVYVTDIQMDADNGEDQVTEQITLRYGAIQVNYWTQDKTGQLSSTPSSANWSQVLNQPSFQVAP